MAILFTIAQRDSLEIFVTLFQMLKAWGVHVGLQLNEDGMYIQAIDKSHVCLTNIFLSKDWFAEYKCECNSRIAVHTAYLAIVLQSALKRNMDRVVFTYDAEEDGDHLSVLCTVAPPPPLVNSGDAAAPAAPAAAEEAPAPKKGRGRKAASVPAAAPAAAPAPPPITDKPAQYDHFFQLPLIELEEDTLAVQDMEYDVDWEVDARFVNTLSDLYAVGGDLRVQCSETRVELSTKGDMGTLTVPIPVDHFIEFAIVEGVSVDVSYNLKYLSEMCSTTKLSKTISISLSADKPLQLRYSLDKGSRVVFYLAPKVADD